MTPLDRWRWAAGILAVLWTLTATGAFYLLRERLRSADLSPQNRWKVYRSWSQRIAWISMLAALGSAEIS